MNRGFKQFKFKKPSTMEQKIQLKHPEGKKAIAMNKEKYATLKNVILQQLDKKGELTHKELLNAITEDFKKNSIKFEGNIQWHIEWVKLDLEANKVIQRLYNTKPHKYTRNTDKKQ